MNDDNILALENVSKYFDFGKVIALNGVTLRLKRGEVHCLLGDNGAGQVHAHQDARGRACAFRRRISRRWQAGAFSVAEGSARSRHRDRVSGPRARATALLSVARNFFMGREPQKKRFGISVMDLDLAAETSRAKLAEMGINVRDPHQPIGTMSGGEKQCLAIARAIHFGAHAY